MVTRLLFFLLLCSIHLSAALTLSECHDLALKNSEKISIADLKMLIEKDRYAEVFGLGLPKLSAHGDYIAAGEASKFLKHEKKANAKVSLVVPLFSFGAQNYLLHAQESVYQSSTHSKERVKQDLIFSVSQTYFRLLESIKIQQVINDSLMTLSEQVRIAQDFHDQGLVHKNDVLIIELQRAQREQEHIFATHNIDISLTRLNRLLGFVQDQETEIEDVLAQPAEKVALHDVLLAATSTHPDLLALQEQMKAANFAKKAEKAQLYPSLYAFMNYSTTNDYSFPYTHGLDVGIGLQFNIYDGGSSWAKIRRKKKEELEIEYRYQGLQDDIETKVRTAYLTLKSNQSKIPLAESMIKMAEENLKMTQELYQEGLSTVYDVLNDEERLAQARSTYLQSLYQIHQAEVDLYYSAGIL